MKKLLFLILILALLTLSVSAQTGTRINILNRDAPGEGFNDPTPKTPVGGNPGTTLGQQRLIAFQFAADLWAALLDSPIEIRVNANFDPLECSADSAVLGSAGPTHVYAGFRNAPFPNMWYVSALASKLAEEDLEEGGAAITARFNSSLNGSPGCAGGASWYYGLDNNPGSNQTDLVVVVLHELGHGLGFLSTTDKETGEFLNNRADIFSNFLFDNAIGLGWTQMSNAQRVDSVTNTGELVWIGTNAVSATPSFLDAAAVFEITAPASLEGRYMIGRAEFGGDITFGGVTASIVAAEDAANSSGPSTTDACTAIVNGATVAGKIALVDRGECTFVIKAKNVQNAGAIAVVVANNVAGSPPGMAGEDPSITIPVISVTQEDGAAIRGQLANGVQASIRLDAQQLAGTDPLGRPKMYAPDPLEQGSSVSHWDTTAEPDLLMEPNISRGLDHGVDLTRDLFADLGWFSNATVESTLRDLLLSDRDLDGRVDPGDSVRLVAAIQNNGDVTGQAVVLDVAIPAGASVVSGSVTGGTVLAAGSRVTVELGALPVGGEKTVTFDLQVDPLLPAGTTSISLQGAVSGTNLEPSVTDDPSTVATDDATVVAISHTPISALKEVELFVDADQSGRLTSGDVLRYRVLITNHSSSPIGNLVLEDTVDPHTTIAPGSVRTTQGIVIQGNQPGDREVVITVGTIQPGVTVEIVYDVTVNGGIPENVAGIQNQAVLSGNGIGNVLTDDPKTRDAEDPTRIDFAHPRMRAVRRP